MILKGHFKTYFFELFLFCAFAITNSLCSGIKSQNGLLQSGSHKINYNSKAS